LLLIDHTLISSNGLFAQVSFLHFRLVSSPSSPSPFPSQNESQGQAPEYALVVLSSSFASTFASLLTKFFLYALSVFITSPFVDSTAPSTALCRLEAPIESLVPGRAIVPAREIVSLEYIDEAVLLIGELEPCSNEGNGSFLPNVASRLLVRTRSYNVCGRPLWCRTTPNSWMELGIVRLISERMLASESAMCLGREGGGHDGR
jgi:hypothetical protein